MQVNTLPDDGTAAKAVCRAMYVVAAVMAGAVVMGLGAAALVGSERIASVDPGGAGALMLLSADLAGGTMTSGGAVVFILVACALFITVLAATASVTLAAAAAIAHDLSLHSSKGKPTNEGSEVMSARWAAAGVGAVGTVLAASARNEDIQQLTTLSLAIAASSVLPALVYSLFWSRYTRRGLLWTLYGGMGSTVALLVSSPHFSGVPSALFPSWRLDWFPVSNVALVSAPIAFLLGYVASVWGGRDAGDGQTVHEKRVPSDFTAR